MGIHQISRNRMIHTVNQEQSLKKGQIIQGKILKIYPNNRVQIQLGSQKMVAQLEASLSVGERYYFQVGSEEDLIHLKVIGEPLKSHVQTNITELLKTLGLKASKGNIHFVQNLIYEKIPFDRADLMESLSLLGIVKNKAEAQHVLKEMIMRRLPINEAVFQALMTTKTTQLSEQMKTVLEQLGQLKNPSELQRSLLSRLSQMTDFPKENQIRFITQIIADVNANHQQLFNTLKFSGLIDQNIDFPTWKSQWQSFSSQHEMAITNASIQSLLQGNMPFSIDVNMFEQTLTEVLNSQAYLKSESQEIMNRWASQMNETVIKNMPLSEQDFAQLRNYMTQRFIPLLTNNQEEQIIDKLQNNPVQLRQLLTTIQQFNAEQTYRGIEQILTIIREQDSFSISSPQEKLLAQVRQMLLFTGLTDENLLGQDLMTAQQNQTVKSMLIQMLQQGDSVGNERVQQLLHHINGLQLQSVQEMGNFIQASLIVPGEKLLLNNDIYIEFESKKTKDGNINPDFCRILFYLDLANIEETIIDIQIQKRLITITVFNDHKHIKQQTHQFLPLLKKGLESLNYQLTNIMIKPLQEKTDMKRDLSSQSVNHSYEGIEFRI